MQCSATSSPSGMKVRAIGVFTDATFLLHSNQVASVSTSEDDALHPSGVRPHVKARRTTNLDIQSSVPPHEGTTRALGDSSMWTDSPERNAGLSDLAAALKDARRTRQRPISVFTRTCWVLDRSQPMVAWVAHLFAPDSACWIELSAVGLRWVFVSY